MKFPYEVKNADELTASEIAIILRSWQQQDWDSLTVEEFKKKFSLSEFHLLKDEDSNICCLTHLNFDFKVELKHSVYDICELVGLVSTLKRKGYAKQLLQEVVSNLQKRKIECIGFCGKELRPFYEKCNIPILYDQAGYLREKISSGQTDANPDDDILIIFLAEDKYQLLAGLDENCIGYLLF